MINSANRMKSEISTVLARVDTSANKVESTSANTVPVVNTSGQLTGSMVNTVA